MDNISQEQPTGKKANILEDVELGVGGILIGITFFVLFLLALNYFNILSLSQLFPKQLGWLPHRASPNPPAGGEGGQTPQNFTPIATPTPSFTYSSGLESCSVKKEGNPLVDFIKEGTIGTDSAQKRVYIYGTFRGNINKLTYDAGKQTATFELIAPKGDQQHTFTLKEEPELVHDATALEDLTLADLKIGQTVVMSFNCDKSNEQFRITRVAITGK